MSFAIAPSTTPPPTLNPLVPVAGFDAGHASGGGIHLNMRRMLLFGLGGALAGTLVPVIPGGPVGGMLLGCALSMIL